MRATVVPSASHVRRASRSKNEVVRVRGDKYDIYPKPDLPNPNTPDQQASRLAWKQGSLAWNGLSEEERCAWSVFARANEHHFARRTPEPLTGYRLFQGSAKYRQILGLPIRSEAPVAAPPAGIHRVELLPSSKADTVRLRLMHKLGSGAGFRMVVSMSPGTNPGRKPQRREARHIRGWGVASTAPLPASGGEVEFAGARFAAQPGQRFGVWVRVVRASDGVASGEFFGDLERAELAGDQPPQQHTRHAIGPIRPISPITMNSPSEGKPLHVPQASLARLMQMFLLIVIAIPAPGQAESLGGVSATPTAGTSATRTLRFPADRSLGTLADLDKPLWDTGPPLHWWSWNGWGKTPQQEIGQARGDVAVAAERRVGLMVTPRGADDELAALADLPPGGIELLGFDSKTSPPSDRCLPALCAMKGLKTLLLEDTEISNDGLSSLTQIASLERIYVLDKDLSSTGIRNICGISSLKGLRLHTSSTVTADHLSPLTRLTALEELCLSGKHSAEVLPQLASLPALRRLRIGVGECCESGLEHLARFPALTHLEFYDLNPRSLAAMPPLPNLRQLDIQYKGATFLPEHLASLAGFPQLENLKLTARFTDDGLAHLKTLKQLKSIGLHPNFQDYLSISDATLAHLAALENLVTVTVYTGEYTDKGLRHLSRLPKLRKLNMPNSGATFSDAGFEHLGKIKTLEELRLRGGDNITDAALVHLERLSSLRSLKFFLPSRVTEEGIARLKSRLPQLRVVENGTPGSN